MVQNLEFDASWNQFQFLPRDDVVHHTHYFCISSIKKHGPHK